jgi:hypothetical protein
MRTGPRLKIRDLKSRCHDATGTLVHEESRANSLDGDLSAVFEAALASYTPR